jgi:hypothetical protein
VSASDGAAPDISGWTAWEKQQYGYFETAVPILYGHHKKHDVFTIGGATEYADVDFVSKFCGRNTDRRSAAQMWQQLQTTVNEKWVTWLQLAGIQ